MRHMVIMAGLLSLLGLAPPAAGAQTTDARQPAGVSTLKVSGMACGACAARVEKTVGKIDGVMSVTVSQPRGTAEIAFDPSKTSLEAIAKVINDKTPFKAESAAASSSKKSKK